MRKILYPKELLQSMASLFSLNNPFFSPKTDIVSSARQSYVFKAYLGGDDITIQYIDGVAILIGTVSNESHKLLARETLANLPGVIGVHSKLEEHGEVATPNKDARLVSKVKSALLFHQKVNVAETEVIAKNGTIILRGKAVSTAQKDLVAEYAKDVEGVNKVRNEMTVTPATLKNGIEIRTEFDTTVESIDDASVTALVKATLFYHRSTKNMEISVETKRGVVKLEGQVGSWKEKILVAKHVNDVPGVRMVFNNLSIERIAPMANQNSTGETL